MATVSTTVAVVNSNISFYSICVTVDKLQKRQSTVFIGTISSVESSNENCPMCHFCPRDP